MRRRAPVVVACAGLLAAAVACLDFVEPEPGPGVLQASLTVLDDEPALVQFSADFRPAADVEGDPEPPADASLRVWDRSLEPTGEGTPFVLAYSSAWTVGPSDLAADRIELHGPRPSGLQARRSVGLPLIWRAGPDSVQAAAGEPVSLPLRGVPAPSVGDPTEIDWQLIVRDTSQEGRFYREEGSGPPPDTVVVPAGVVPADVPGPPLQARLDVDAAVSVSARSAPPELSGYEVRFRMFTRLDWHLLRP